MQSVPSFESPSFFSADSTPAPAALRKTPWLGSKAFDLTMLVASVVIVPIVLVAMWLGASSASINLGVTAMVGGPHVFATFSKTFADRGFRSKHPWLTCSGLLIPLGVVYMTIHHFQILISVFIVAASLHVLHQCAYLADCYRAKAGRKERPWARLIDYGFIFTSIYPIAIYKIVDGSFYLGDVPILIPRALMRIETVYLQWVLSSTFLVLWLNKSVTEYRERTLNVPKTVLIGVTAIAAFLVPGSAGRERLDLAFQSMNAWHSFQYLGLIWLINTMRKERGQLTNKFVARLSGTKGAKWFYLFNFAIAVVLLGVVKGVVDWNPLGLTADQYYYMLILSPLLIHYYFDTFVFLTSVSELVPPWAPSTSFESAMLSGEAASAN